MNSHDLNTQNNHRYGWGSRISLRQTHSELNNGIVYVTIPFANEWSDSIILVLKVILIFVTTH